MQQIALANINTFLVAFTFFLTIWLDRRRNQVKGPIFYYNHAFLNEAKYYSSQNFTNLQFILIVQNGGDRPGTQFIKSMILSLKADNEKFELKFKEEGDNPYVFEHPFQINEISRKGFSFRVPKEIKIINDSIISIKGFYIYNDIEKPINEDLIIKIDKNFHIKKE